MSIVATLQWGDYFTFPTNLCMSFCRTQSLSLSSLYALYSNISDLKNRTWHVCISACSQGFKALHDSSISVDLPHNPRVVHFEIALPAAGFPNLKCGGGLRSNHLPQKDNQHHYYLTCLVQNLW